MFFPPAAVPANPISLLAHSSQTNTIFVAGTWMNSASSRTFLVKNPATLEVIGECADGDGSAAIAALEAAYRAFDDWSRVPPEQRATHLHHLAQLVQRDQAALADLLIAESGKPRREALGEVSSSVSYLHWNAEEATRVHGRTLAAPRPSVCLWTQKQPIGVVVAITPWNYPLNTLCRKIAPALAAGCTVIAKPAPQTPLTAIAFMRLAEEAKIPAGVLNLVTTSQTEETVRVWMDDSRVRKIAFTGSTAVGVRLVKESAATLKRVSLELGGHAPALVFDDACLESAADAIVQSRFRHAGQTCICVQRIYVRESAAQQLLHELQRRIERLKVGNGSDPQTDIGPLIHEKAWLRVRSHVEDALAKGAVLHCGGQRLELPEPNRGYFFQPTLFDRVCPEMRIMQEETFGPVLTLTRFSTEAQAIAEANSTAYGLVAYAFTRDLGRAHRLVERLDFGTVGINETLVVSPHLPFGGLKESGVGKENGSEGLDEYLELKSAVVRLPEERVAQ
jgi:succinate-semialdehyde dehydrogenase / glutarate-semialdehyde dehydrogenase